MFSLNDQQTFQVVQHKVLSQSSYNLINLFVIINSPIQKKFVFDILPLIFLSMLIRSHLSNCSQRSLIEGTVNGSN